MPDETAATLAQTFVDMFSECGLPKTVLSDHGPNLHSAHFNDLCKWLGVAHNYTTCFHPQGNPVERANKTTGQVEHCNIGVTSTLGQGLQFNGLRI